MVPDPKLVQELRDVHRTALRALDSTVRALALMEQSAHMWTSEQFHAQQEAVDDCRRLVTETREDLELVLAGEVDAYHAKLDLSIDFPIPTERTLH